MTYHFTKVKQFDADKNVTQGDSKWPYSNLFDRPNIGFYL